MTLLPRRWHIYIVNPEPRVGTKPGKQRPCVAVQPSEFGEAGLQSTVVLPLTTKLAPGDAYPLRVKVSKGTCGLERDSEILVDQMLAWDNSLFFRDLGMLPEALIEKLAAAMRDFLDL